MSVNEETTGAADARGCTGFAADPSGCAAAIDPQGCAAAIDPRDRVIVALDCDGAHARELASQLAGHARWLKVGMTLFYEEGPAIVSEFVQLGFKVFVDLKLCDIPHQVEGAARSLAHSGASMLTLHASGGRAMMEAACKGVADGTPVGVDRPIVLAVTVLTSTDDAMLADIGVARNMADQVEALAKLAKTSGCDGIVCSPVEAASMRHLLGDGAFIVTPGVRPAGSSADDQKRIATPANAVLAGASHIVIGRPVTQAADPVDAFESIVDQIPVL